MDDDSQTCQLSWDCCYDVPLLDSLKQLLNNRSILQEVSLLQSNNVIACITIDFERPL